MGVLVVCTNSNMQRWDGFWKGEEASKYYPNISNMRVLESIRLDGRANLGESCHLNKRKDKKKEKWFIFSIKLAKESIVNGRPLDL